MSEEEAVEFSFKQNSAGMAFIDPSKDLSDVVPADQPLVAPLWIVETLYNYFVDGDIELTRIQMPKYLYSEDLLHTITQLAEDSRVNEETADLRQKSLYFY